MSPISEPKGEQQEQPELCECGRVRKAKGKCRHKRWSENAERTFLERLAVSCNVTASAEAAKFSREAVYHRRMNDAAFAARWDAALDQGYTRIEMLLIRRAEQSLEGIAIDPDSPIPRMTVAEATNVLRLHRPAVREGQRGRYHWRLKPADPEKAREEIRRYVKAVRKAKGYDDGL